ncbi:hypothetical protein EV667_2002 [Ancylobacter aquaticus]|uniref:Uncharacterized protein n=1 Tax=Ancylobacter aquaticus TaxID=100 RepID=A0A4V2PJD0_ANCAQ|nr:hypothetical protein [Ancylobacter aquaticus]TCK28006.1 hypothetical protein EV667_2002 [Ancylobacter aquaticus]
MVETPLDISKVRPVTPQALFVIAALRRQVAALEGVDEASLPAEFRFARDGIEVRVTATTWIICEAPEASS